MIPVLNEAQQTFLNSLPDDDVKQIVHAAFLTRNAYANGLVKRSSRDQHRTGHDALRLLETVVDEAVIK